MLIIRNADELEEGDEVAIAQMPHRAVIERKTHRAEGWLFTLEDGMGQFRVPHASEVVVPAETDNRFISPLTVR